MNRDRRGFLRALLTGGAGLALGATVDVDRLLWVPGARTYFLPPAVPHAATLEWMALEALKVLEDRLQVASLIARRYDRRPFEGLLGIDVGSGVAIREPARFRREALEPAMELLAAECQERGVQRFGGLTVPTGVEAVTVGRPGGGPVLRGVRYYEAGARLPVLRFDVLGRSE